MRKGSLDLLKNINSINQSQFEKRLATIFARGEIAGPLACAYVFQNMKKRVQPKQVLGSTDRSL